ncbi:hypothetical protein BDN72DRAFT_813484 [Pluteus cervinus]|uniref:Uncharacterized protein n=1 Tax=Pluteus cervinus TaxID=181527 RepID=A0ACD3B8E0_9AGAR|nr:hypothetical protein BDN72DRAFT_813484 [Pluteus cervinus]
MPDIRLTALVLLSVVVVTGTYYSVTNETYLDTSNPSLTHLSHHLSKTHYFASKSNFLNVYFIKQAWGWTTLVFFLTWFTSPSAARAKRRILKWGVETAVWLAFAGWFFGPAIIERFIVASGGECVLSLPSGDYITLPEELCYAGASVSPRTHPELFKSTFVLSPDWRARPRLRKGHDVSGHTFLLAMAILFLVDQLRPSLRERVWSPLHKVAITLHVALIAIWFVAVLTTSLYFHVPFEKYTGLALGIAGFAISQIIPDGPIRSSKH